MKHVFITGGTGLIGSHFIRTYQDQYRFTVLSRQHTPIMASDINVAALTVVNDLQAFANFNDVDIVINLAGQPLVEQRWSRKQKQKICQSRWQLTEQLSKLISDSESPPECFLSGSAIGYYGRQGDQDIDEDFTEVYPEFSHQVCKVWEDKARLCQNHTRLCLLRTGIVLDRNRGALAKMIPAYRLGFGGKLGDGKQIMSWIHIQDMVDAMQFLIEHQDIKGAVNMTAPNPVSNKAFSKALASSLNRPDFATMPAFVLRGLFGEMADLLLYGQRVLPIALLKAGFMFKYSELEDALQQIFK
ncbi:TIGR01777 family oxidoreductase [Thalassotalea mangrovi]|uniref:TIGR01777 family protein n=1 Tax=Thalassotalea mangrovi TaxID=2572245 RepID=A0A4U1B6H0_9GAMM|nr:TIGR01777 family oxidoreductase [Thalassotalea mangrovi]TKB45752.1 TIGR01777 family protein [Thalassotalea mangrovi]